MNTSPRWQRSLALLGMAGLVAGLAAASAVAQDGPALVGKGKAKAKANGQAAKRLAQAAASEPDWLFERRNQLEVEVAQAELEMKQAELAIRQAEVALRTAERAMRRNSAELALLRKLDERVTMRFPNPTPFEDVLKYVKKATAGPDDSGIPIYVDPVGLQEAEKTMSSPVTLDMEGVPLSTTLRLVLRQLGLVYELKNGLLTITSEESEDRPVVTPKKSRE